MVCEGIADNVIQETNMIDIIIMSSIRVAFLWKKIMISSENPRCPVQSKYRKRSQNGLK